MSRCPSRQQLLELLAELLSDAEHKDLEGHVATCRSCQETLARLTDDEGADWRRLRGPAAPPPTASEVDFLRRLKGNPPPSGDPASGPKGGAGPAAIRFPGPPTAEGPLGRLDGYHIVKQLGEGAFGFVYQAYDALGRLVAIKILKPGLAANTRERARFAEEARKCAAVKHDHVVTIYQVGDTAGFPLPYIVMEYIEGESLSDRLGRQRVLEPEEAARVAEQVARGLAAAHARGLVHRDVKPSNIMLESDSGRAKVMDFGLARAMDGAGERMASSGGLVGTPAYMSPEQINSPDRVDQRSDVYSLGVVLYELLTGEQPFRGASPLVLLRRVAHDEPRPPRRLNSKIPRDLETICLKCLQKEPRRRYADGRALAEDLGRFLGGRSIRARPAGRLERFGRWCRRQPAQAGLVAAVALILVGGIFALTQWLMLRQADELHKSDVARSYNQFGERQAAEGRPDAACGSFRCAVAILQDLVRKEPGNYGYHRRLGNSFYHLGKAQQQLGRTEEALLAYRNARSHHLLAIEKAPRQWPYRGGEFYNIARDLALCSTLVEDRGIKLRLQGKPEECPGYADRAMEALRQAIANGFDDVEHLRSNADLQALRTREDFRELLRELDRAEKRRAERSGESATAH
jgi:tetratricopeptide (TPR) repeat protein